MKVPGLKEAVAKTSSSEHVVPLRVSYQEPAPLCVEELWVDAFGGLWFRSYDGTNVVLPKNKWPVLIKLISFASR